MWFFNLVVDQNGDSIALTRAKEKTMSETVEIQNLQYLVGFIEGPGPDFLEKSWIF